ncbi:putative tRNA-splicing endonuclease subunit Sen2 [Xylariomycetidae sp. FL0641]|nr:putative tRNA-splicing endonuclease subunit Sen2 [Xylariomycetidae sp. FL0641]
MSHASNSPASMPQQDAATPAPSAAPVDSEVKPNGRPPAPRGPPLHQIYALPVPIRTYPLPSFYPSNPLSLFHLLYTWVRQVVSPPPAEPAVVHGGIWSQETRSVHILETKSIRALWEQGFFGKGNYSRSEPNWYKREESRKGKHQGHVAENFTAKRREERKLMKWERARKEQEAIMKTRLEEAWIAPVGPKELLALPNSLHDLRLRRLNGIRNEDVDEGTRKATEAIVNRIIDGETLLEPARVNNPISMPKNVPSSMNGRATPDAETSWLPTGNGSVPNTPPRYSDNPSPRPSPASATSTLKRQKSVRFSPKVESTTFKLFDPPSPSYSPQGNGKPVEGTMVNGHSSLSKPANITSKFTEEISDTPVVSNGRAEAELVDREHLQLCPEEAFYLVFALGALAVTDDMTGKEMSARELFGLFRQHSYFPPRTTGLRPDDPFLIHYAVYHHFRSLGWVVRPGIKFGVDWMLYHRGPVFSHAEFALIVLPSYTDKRWQGEKRQSAAKSWHWLHSINRVQATALKTLVLIYVDIPPPCEEVLDPTTAFKRYKIREFMVRRWQSNRNRG